MRFQEWINEIISSGLLCGAYTAKVDEAKSKARLMDLCLDANGASWLCEMDAKGMPLPYDTILNEFKPYLNGRYVGKFYNKSGKLGYTSSIYCCFSDYDSIDIQTTLTTFLGCKSEIWVSGNDFVRIYADKNCELVVYCPPTSRCIVEYWNGAKIIDGLLGGKVELIAHE